jgi:hypothetical protein
MKFTLFILVVIATTFTRASASSEEDEAKARALVKQLGSDSFKVRELAARVLIELGGASKKALEEGGKSTDAEVAERCRKLLPKVYELYVQRLLKQHFTDPKLPLSEDLPGAKRWLEITGRSNESKSSYLEILFQYHKLLVHLANYPETIDEQYEKLVRELHGRIESQKGSLRKNGLTQVDLALFLFVATDPNLKPKEWAAPKGYPPTYFIVTQIDLNTLLDPQISPEPFKKLFVEYLAGETNHLALRRGVQLAESAKLKEALPAILTIAKDKKTRAPLRVAAVRAAGLLGGRDALPELALFFNDNDSFGTIVGDGKVHQLQVRDVALAMAIHLHGQKLTDFGFKYDLPKSKNLEDEDWYLHLILMDEAREPALTKWKAFAENFTFRYFLSFTRPDRGAARRVREFRLGGWHSVTSHQFLAPGFPGDRRAVCRRGWVALVGRPRGWLGGARPTPPRSDPRPSTRSS